ncbi:MAG TPA: 3-phosphoshikimate 1-carboxyvinyltransferase [Allosphingosinicella sp.]|jgi:3-phosphoshikimate 1-carboxyvinyltransferase
MQQAKPRPGVFTASGPLRGTGAVPGDKSISHRALILSALARGQSEIAGLSGGGDVLSTASALRALGARIERDGEGWTVDGVGTGALLQPAEALDMGNSGTSARLLMGLLATHQLTATFIGDGSLSRRPMNRVIAPLSRLGATFTAAPGGRLPLTLKGYAPAAPLFHRMEVASAQVKSALLLAALNTPGITRVLEPVPTRDHSERMLLAAGADLEIEETGEGRLLSLHGEAELKPQRIRVPADPSQAAFLLVAALIVPGSEVSVEGVGINPTRAGLIGVLQEMGADLTLSNHRDEGGEPVADLTARHSALRAVDVPPDLAPSMIDEFPIFFIAAAFAHGTSRTSGLAELRVKESDRLAAMAAGLAAIGVPATEGEDGLAVTGTGGDPLPGGASIDPRLDHRIAMSFAVAGLHARAAIEVRDMAPADTSFPRFETQLERLAS